MQWIVDAVEWLCCRYLVGQRLVNYERHQWTSLIIWTEQQTTLPAMEPLSAPLHSAQPTPVFHHLTGRASFVPLLSGTAYQHLLSRRYAVLGVPVIVVAVCEVQNVKNAKLLCNRCVSEAQNAPKLCFLWVSYWGSLWYCPRTPGWLGRFSPPLSLASWCRRFDWQYRHFFFCTN